MDTPTLRTLTEMNDKLAKMRQELDMLQNYTKHGSTFDSRSMQLYGDNLNRGIHMEKIPYLKDKVFNLVLAEYEKEFNRLYREYDELTICKPNGKVTTFKPVDLISDRK